MNNRRRRGRVVVTKKFMENYDKIRALQKDMIVWHTESNPMTDTITFWCEHPDFEQLEICQVVPRYDGIIFGAGKNTSVKFVKFNDIRMDTADDY